MTAYELALKIEEAELHYANSDDDWILIDSANMLRKQADDIAEYKKQIKEQAKEIIKLEIEAEKKPLKDDEILKNYQNSFDWDGKGLWSFNFKKFAESIEKAHGIG